MFFYDVFLRCFSTMFSYEFSLDLKICYLKIDVSCGLPSIFITSHKMLRLPSKVLRLPRKMTMDSDGQVQSAAAPAMKTATHLLKTSQKYYACHTKGLSTRYQTRLNVTKRHACHAKQSNATCETSTSDPFCRTYHRHGHTGITWTVADGCKRLWTVAGVNVTSSEPPDPQSETGTLATHSGKKENIHMCSRKGSSLHSKAIVSLTHLPQAQTIV